MSSVNDLRYTIDDFTDSAARSRGILEDFRRQNGRMLGDVQDVLRGSSNPAERQIAAALDLAARAMRNAEDQLDLAIRDARSYRDNL